MSYDRQAFARRLRLAQQRSGKTQTELAAILNVHVNRVSEWTHGKQVPKVGLLAELADAVDVDLHWLITGRVRAVEHAAAVIDELVRATPTLAALAARGQALADADPSPEPGG